MIKCISSGFDDLHYKIEQKPRGEGRLQSRWSRSKTMILAAFSDSAMRADIIQAMNGRLDGAYERCRQWQESQHAKGKNAEAHYRDFMTPLPENRTFKKVRADIMRILGIK
jgi:hypothetical protein